VIQHVVRIPNGIHGPVIRSSSNSRSSRSPGVATELAAPRLSCLDCGALARLPGYSL
jgi:hypothetical protein